MNTALRFLSIAIIAALTLAGAARAAAHGGGHAADSHAPAAASHDDDAAHAAHGDDHGAASANPMAFEIVPFVATLVVFGIVFFILSSKVWPKINQALAAREEKIRGDIEQAERSRKQANAALQQYEQALAEARTEAARMLDQARIEQQKVAAQLKSRTEAEIAEMKNSAMRDIESARRAAVADIYNQIAISSTAIAGKILQREIKESDQRRLVEESLEQLEAASR